ncbi:MAG: hypothetical protein HY648_04405 [Acidobacteria bacterium]|nr:hypothetical protein [Acidobacteriota bacterium]
MEEFFKWAEPLGSIATAFGVFLVLWQIWRAAQQARTDFEDDLAREYRELTRGIPTQTLLGEELSQGDHADAFKYFYYYVDLSNEQTFLRQKGRVSKETWLFWCDGIKSNLSRPAFKTAWEEIKARAPASFEELRKLELSNFAEDPRYWK